MSYVNNSDNSVKDLMAFIGLTEQRIGQLVADGVVVKLARGEYDIKQSIFNYCEYLRGVSRGSDEVADEKAERTRLISAKADIAELEADEKAGLLIRKDAVETVNKKVAVTLNANLIGIADRVAPLVAASDDGAECHHLINAEVRNSLDSALGALGQIEVDDRLLDITRRGAIEVIEKHEEIHADFIEDGD